MIRPSSFRKAVQANQRHYEATRQHNRLRTTTSMRIEREAIADVAAANAQVLQEMGIDPKAPTSVHGMQLTGRLLAAVNRAGGVDWSKVYE